MHLKENEILNYQLLRKNSIFFKSSLTQFHFENILQNNMILYKQWYLKPYVNHFISKKKIKWNR
jgi:hypothetical protein